MKIYIKLRRDKMKNNSLLIIMVVVSLVFCITSVNTEAAKEFTFAITMEDTGVDRELTQRFKEKVAELSNGTMQINLFMSGVLGDTRELMEQMKMGEVDLGYYAEFGQLYYPEYDATTIPFLWPGQEEIEEYFAGPAGEIAKKAVRDEGGAILLGAMHSYGSRWMSSNKLVRTAEDFDGIKMRMPNISWWIEVWKEVGVSPTPISSAEIFSALNTGVVEAQENYLSNIYGRKLWEVQDYLIATEHIDFYQMWACSEKTWNSLTNEEQEILVKAANDAVEYVQPQIEEMNNGFIEELKENGMEVIYPDKESIRKAAEPAIRKIMEDDLAPEAIEAIEKYL